MEYSESNRTESKEIYLSINELNSITNNTNNHAMSLLRRVLGYVAGMDAICGSGSGEDDASFTGITGITGITSRRVNHRAKATSETGIQVGVPISRAEKQEQRRHHMLTSGIQRLRATVAAQTSSTTSRLTSDSEDYHIGRTISKLLKPEKKTDGIAEEHTCCVCLDSVCNGNTNMTRTGCGHVFHMTCLLKSLRVKNTCPMCRWELEDTRPGHQVPNVLTPVSSEQIITEEISYFPNAAHTQSIVHSRHPKRRLKELLRVFGFALLRTVAEYIHEDNMPTGWYDDSETTDDSEEDEEDEEGGPEGGPEGYEEEEEEEDNGYDTDDIDINDVNDVNDIDGGEVGAANEENVIGSVEYSDSFPEPYSNVEEQIRDTRGTPRNIHYNESYWRYILRGRPPLPSPQIEDLRESLNRMI